MPSKLELKCKMNDNVSSADDDNVLKECHEKVMKSFRSLLSILGAFLLPAMAAVFTVDDKWHNVSDYDRAVLVTAFHFTGSLCMFALIVSHSTTDARKWTRLVSLLTRIVCIASLVLFHMSMAFFTPEQYEYECSLCMLLFLGSSVAYLLCEWGNHFVLPKMAHRN